MDHRGLPWRGQQGLGSRAGHPAVSAARGQAGGSVLGPEAKSLWGHGQQSPQRNGPGRPPQLHQRTAGRHLSAVPCPLARGSSPWLGV